MDERLRAVSVAKPPGSAIDALLSISSEHSREERPAPIVIEGARPPAALARESGGAVHLVVLVELLQELLVDGVQVCEEEVVHWSILNHHCKPRRVPERCRRSGGPVRPRSLERRSAPVVAE